MYSIFTYIWLIFMVNLEKKSYMDCLGYGLLWLTNLSQGFFVNHDNLPNQTHGFGGGKVLLCQSADLSCPKNLQFFFPKRKKGSFPNCWCSKNTILGYFWVCLKTIGDLPIPGNSGEWQRDLLTHRFGSLGSSFYTVNANDFFLVP